VTEKSKMKNTINGRVAAFLLVANYTQQGKANAISETQPSSSKTSITRKKCAGREDYDQKNKNHTRHYKKKEDRLGGELAFLYSK